MVENEVIKNIRYGLSGDVYTQLSDIEEELNGIMTYDRKIDKIDHHIVREMSEKIKKEFEKVT